MKFIKPCYILNRFNDKERPLGVKALAVCWAQPLDGSRKVLVIVKGRAGTRAVSIYRLSDHPYRNAQSHRQEAFNLNNLDEIPWDAFQRRNSN